MRRRLAMVATAACLVAACSSGQDPSFEPPGADQPSTTSNTLPPCPAGGPDASTPPAGCVDDDGTILRP